ncbi:MAG: GDP-mannose 4,6-dehydratase [Planctomycetales bacterium]|nr:GDP-mannose 4,6-dehydratase [Planctomycetales bacterium]
MNPKINKSALVTGITGQDGSYLAELLLDRGYRVFGMVRRSSSSSTQRIDHLIQGDTPRVQLVPGDLADIASLRQVLEATRPDEVYNLAAQSHVSVSFQMPIYTSDVTGMGALRLLEALRELQMTDVRLYQAASSEMFGNATESPQSEQTPLMPRNPYAVAKVFAFHAVRTYREAYGMFAVNGILFNHESPRRGKQFVTRKISSGVAEIVHGKRESIALGNLAACRDWGYAGDYVEAMWQMLQQDSPSDLVVATGETHSVREFCDRAFAHAGLPLQWRGEGLNEHGVDKRGVTRVHVDPEYFRPAEVNYLLGNPARAKAELGWAPQVSFGQLVEMMVDADLAATGGGGAQAASRCASG